MSLKVALLQMDIVFGNPEANYCKAEEMIAEAALEDPDVVVLPELWTTGYDLDRLDTIADPEGARTSTFISAQAKKYNINIVAGSVAVKKKRKVYNTMLAFNRQGNLIKDYQKAHLFRLMREEKFLSAGENDGVFSIEGIQAAGVICYDIRFPEWIRAQALKGAGILFVPAEWPALRTNHWRALLTARAIENQCFVIACNRVGEDPDNAFGGHSMVIDPWGEVLAEGGTTEQILYSTINPEHIADIRKRIPVFEDRRPEIYDGLWKK